MGNPAPEATGGPIPSCIEVGGPLGRPLPSRDSGHHAPGVLPRPRGPRCSGRRGASDGGSRGPSAPEGRRTFGAVQNTQRRLTPSGEGQHDEGSLGATPTPEGEYRGFPGANGGCPGKETPGGLAPWDQVAPGVSEGTRSLSSA